MEQGFIDILNKIIIEQGKDVLLNTSKCKAFLADYTMNEYKKECRLFLLAFEAGVHKAIETTNDLTLCKKQQIKNLHENYSLSEKAAADIVDTLVFVLRGDVSKSITMALPLSDVNKIKQPIIQMSKSMPKKGSIIFFGGYDWLVLEVQNDKALILSERIIEFRAYNKKLTNVKWETCTLRSYLNAEFYNRFTHHDRSQILETNVIYSNKNMRYGHIGNPTKDMIFLLSIEEAVKYFGDSGQLKKGPIAVWHLNDQYNSERIANDVNGKPSRWWLRSPPSYGTSIIDFVAYVGSSGSLNIDLQNIFVENFGVRPAFWLSL